jgi:hypothetical protein
LKLHPRLNGMQTRFLNGCYRTTPESRVLVRIARGRDCFPDKIPTALYVGSRKQNVHSRSATPALWSQAAYLSRSLHYRGQLSVRPAHPSWPTRATETIMAIRRRRHISHNASTSTITFVRGIFSFSAWPNMARNTVFSFWRLGDFKMK